MSPADRCCFEQVQPFKHKICVDCKMPRLIVSIKEKQTDVFVLVSASVFLSVCLLLLLFFTCKQDEGRQAGESGGVQV